MTIDRESVRINQPIPAGAFRIEFAPGTTLADSSGSQVIAYRVNENGEWIQVP